MRGFILTLGGEKGGPGKSTIATNLAAMLAAAGVDVALVNTDRQETARYWCQLRAVEHDSLPRVQSMTLRGQAIHKDLAGLREKYEAIIVDAAGQDSVEQRAALMVTNRLLVPIRPSQFDVWTLSNMADLVDKARTLNEGLDACIFGNQIQAVSRVRDVAAIEAIAKDYPQFRLLRAVVIARVAFQHAGSQGLAVTEMPRPDAKAKSDILGLYQEVFADVGHAKSKLQAAAA